MGSVWVKSCKTLRIANRRSQLRIWSCMWPAQMKVLWSTSFVSLWSLLMKSMDNVVKFSSEVHKYGILETDDDLKVTGFLEKPQPSETTSRKEVFIACNLIEPSALFLICMYNTFDCLFQCPCFYIFNKDSLPMLSQFLEDKKVTFLKFFSFFVSNFFSYTHVCSLCMQQEHLAGLVNICYIELFHASVTAFCNFSWFF